MHKATYGDLDKALLALGFTVKSDVNEFGFHFNFYENFEYEAWIVVSGAPKEQRLRPGDLLVAERTVVGRGVAESDKFHKLLDRPNAAIQARAS